MKLSILTVLVFLLSCSATKRANKHIEKAMQLDSTAVAKYTRKAFPCIITGSDTTVLINDSLVYIDCPENNNDYAFTVHDTIRTKFVQNKTVKVPVYVPVKTVYIRQLIEDSAKIKVFADLHKNELTKIGNLEKKVGNKNTWLKVLSGLLIAAALVITALIKFKR